MKPAFSTHPRDNLTTWQARAGEIPPVLTEILTLCQTSTLDSTECVDVLNLLALLGCDAQTQAATLWFGLAQVEPERWQTAAPNLPPDLRRLVEGQQAAEQVWMLHAQRQADGSSEGLRRLLLAIIRDMRVVFVLLAQQMAKLRAATSLTDTQQRTLARLTADIHVPLANRLGIWQLKWELEDLAFRYLEPDLYHRIATLLDGRRVDRESFIREVLDQLQHALDDAGIHAEVYGRAKHIYSIWKKMQKKGLEFDELYDIRAIRVLVNNVTDCYATLGVVHALWPQLQDEFDDYLARPKPNGYRSLHTAVIGPHEKNLEVQIRTHDMHRANELGVAAHWRYKEGGSSDAEFERKIALMRHLLDSCNGEDGTQDDSLRTELLEDRVYLLTPKGEVMDLPRRATVLDFAYHIHTEVGHRCCGAKVNDRIVPLNFQPESGDRVEVLTRRQGEPGHDWLLPHHGYLNTSRGRAKVRLWFRRSAREINLANGRAMFERELRRLALTDTDVSLLPAQFHMKTHDEMMVALATGDISTQQIARVLVENVQPVPWLTRSTPSALTRQVPSGHHTLNIEGVENLLITLARCCQPLPGDTLCGYVTRGRGVSVHQAHCSNMTRLIKSHPDRVTGVTWTPETSQTYEVDIKLQGNDHAGLQKDVTQVIHHANISIIASASHAYPQSGEVEISFTLRVHDYRQLSTLLSRLTALPNILDARRADRH